MKDMKPGLRGCRGIGKVEEASGSKFEPSVASSEVVGLLGRRSRADQVGCCGESGGEAG